MVLVLAGVGLFAGLLLWRDLVRRRHGRLAALRTEGAISALVQALADPDSQVRSTASAGLRALPKLAGPALREALASEDPLLRERAQEPLRELER